MTRELQTTSEVIEALGGPTAIGLITGRSTQAAWNWKQTGRLPADTYLVISKALELKDLAAPIALWGMVPALDERQAAS